MTENEETKTPSLTTFYVRPFSITSLPEGVRAWMTIAAIAAAVSFIVCTIISGFLLIRLGWDALWEAPPGNQEMIKNFLLAFASTFGIPFLIWRTWVAHQQARSAAEQARVALENHITGIFSKSVELMGLVRESKIVGANGEQITRSTPNIESRLGALYSLERLLAESTKDQRAVLETLCAYVRENSPLVIPENKAEANKFIRGKLDPSPTQRADVQAALTIIGRRPRALIARAKAEGWRLDLRNANLVGYDLSELNYDYARFTNSYLDRADMSGGSFLGCVFHWTYMRATKMGRACFHSANFKDCDVKDAEIEATDFSLATLANTDLRSAKAISFDLKGANLENAFGSFLKYSIESVKKDGANSINAMEILSIHQLFQKATCDANTSMSEEVREAILMMSQRRTAQDAQVSQERSAE